MEAVDHVPEYVISGFCPLLFIVLARTLDVSGISNLVTRDLILRRICGKFSGFDPGPDVLALFKHPTPRRSFNPMIPKYTSSIFDSVVINGGSAARYPVDTKYEPDARPLKP